MASRPTTSPKWSARWSVFSEQGPARSDDGDDGLTVETLIADIAAVFHWPLSDLAEMDLADLLDWHRRAVAAWNRMNRTE
jgi:hypothetical protein